MRKKVLSLTLVAAMMAGCLAGCGNADSKDEGTTAAAGDSTTQAAASDDAIQNLIDATTGTVDLSVWASEEDQISQHRLLKNSRKSIQMLTSTSHSEPSQSQRQRMISW